MPNTVPLRIGIEDVPVVTAMDVSVRGRCGAARADGSTGAR